MPPLLLLLLLWQSLSVHKRLAERMNHFCPRTIAWVAAAISGICQQRRPRKYSNLNPKGCTCLAGWRQRVAFPTHCVPGKANRNLCVLDDRQPRPLLQPQPQLLLLLLLLLLAALRPRANEALFMSTTWLLRHTHMCVCAREGESGVYERASECCEQMRQSIVKIN